jgi:hypothetical protein
MPGGAAAVRDKGVNTDEPSVPEWERDKVPVECLVWGT